MEKREVNFRVSSALKDLIGRELITNDYVAVFELVKNSFDAKATSILVFFDLYDKKIVIKDNGTGMSIDDIEKNWLFIGFSEKRDNKNDLLSGSKGIGRFSCDRLGTILTLETVKDGYKSSFSIDWSVFENNQNSEIQSERIEIESKPDYSENGTTITISNLRRNWAYKDVLKAKDQLLRLLSPNTIDEKRHLSISVKDEIGAVTEFSDLHNDVFDYMKTRVVCISATFNSDSIVTVLSDHGRKILKNVSENNTLVKSAHMELFFADKGAKTIFKRKTGVDLVMYGNLFVYKNNFRIYPFGERGFDVFSLTQRKTQGYNRYLGPREIIGWISIIDKENHFVEATSRDRGFIDNEYTTSLQESYMEYLHRPLEKYVELIKYGNISLDDYLRTENAGFVLNEMARSFEMKDSINTELDDDFLKSKTTEDILDQIYNKDLSKTDLEKAVKTAKDQALKLKTDLGRAEKSLAETKIENTTLKKEIEAKNAFIETENPSRQKVLEHDLGLVLDELYESIDSLKSISASNNDEKKLLLKVFCKIGWSIFRIKSIRKVILKTKIDTIKKKAISFGDFFEDYKVKLFDDEGISVSIHKNGAFVAKVILFDLITIFDNVFSNVKSMGGKKLDIYVFDNKIQFVSDTFSEGSNIDFSRVFDFGYSTKNGTGMGLYFIKQICSECKLQVSMNRIDDTNLVNMEISKNA